MPSVSAVCQRTERMVNVYIAGCRGVPMGYGGYESFVDKLVTYQEDCGIQYHIASLDDPRYEKSRYRGAVCIPHSVPKLGPLTMVVFDLMALRTFVRRIRDEQPENPVIYVLTCRIGPLFGRYVRQLHKLGAVVCLNPDGHEWKRRKWNALVRAGRLLPDGRTLRAREQLRNRNPRVHGFRHRPATGAFDQRGGEQIHAPAAQDHRL